MLCCLFAGLCCSFLFVVVLIAVFVVFHVGRVVCSLVCLCLMLFCLLNVSLFACVVFFCFFLLLYAC